MELKASLYYKGGNSDKEYHLQLQAQDGGLFLVRAQNGRRGGTLVSRDKTPKPVAYDVALKKYQSVLKEKLSEGYTEGAAGTAFVGGEMEDRITGIVPQLLNPIGEDEVERFLADAAFCLQEKHDGHRRLVRRAGSLQGINRKGLAVGLPQTVVDALQSPGMPLQFVLDGELLGDTLAVFDLLELDEVDLRFLPCRERIERLGPIGRLLQGTGSGVFVTPTAFSEADKRARYASLKAQGVEGGVFKRVDAPYVAGRPHSGGDQVKRKFTHDASFIVAACSATRRSVALALLDAAGRQIGVGNVTVPSNHAMPETGMVVDVNYLYAYPGGALAQPQYKGPRDDIDAHACTLAQLHLKREAADEDDEAAGA